MRRRIVLVLIAAAACASAVRHDAGAQMTGAGPTPAPAATPISIRGPVLAPSFPTPAPELNAVKLQPITVLNVPAFGVRANDGDVESRSALRGNSGEAAALGGTPAELAARSSALVVARHETTRRWLAAHPDAVAVRLRSSR